MTVKISTNSLCYASNSLDYHFYNIQLFDDWLWSFVTDFEFVQFIVHISLWFIFCFLIGYEGESISNQPNLFPVEIHLFFFDVIAL